MPAQAKLERGTPKQFSGEEVDGPERAQAAGDFGDVVVLEEADGGDASGSCDDIAFVAKNLTERDSAEGEHWDGVLAGLMEGVETGGWSAGTVLLFEDGGEEGEIGAVLGGLVDVFRPAAGLADR